MIKMSSLVGPERKGELWSWKKRLGKVLNATNEKAVAFNWLDFSLFTCGKAQVIE